MDKPKLHMWETGVMRITRHPQSFGQALWCLAHTLWIGSSFVVATTGKRLAAQACTVFSESPKPAVACIREVQASCLGASVVSWN